MNPSIWIDVTITSLFSQPDPQGRPKVLLVGGGIANFTNVAATFKGLIKALREFDAKLKAVNARIYVRRAGPNYQEGLRMMRELDGVSRHPLLHRRLANVISELCID
jgi:succinyl-CoA synthetase beta subunit